MNKPVSGGEEPAIGPEDCILHHIASPSPTSEELVERAIITVNTRWTTGDWTPTPSQLSYARAVGKALFAALSTPKQDEQRIRAEALEEAATKMDSINMPTCARIIRSLIQKEEGK